MQIAFCSNFLSSHQMPICEALYRMNNGNFRFIATQPLSEIRKSMGWKEECEPYVIASYESEETYREALDYVKNADVLIVSGDEKNIFFDIAIRNKKTIIFRCCERPYKRGRWRVVSPRGLKLRWNSYCKHPKINLYMLCSSAYTAGDYAILGSYIGHTYKWGYFIKVEELDITKVAEDKQPGLIFWAGRLLDCKRPELAIQTAAYLKNKNIAFRMELAGDGPLKEMVAELIEKEGLQECVHLLGNLSQEETLARMKKASIYLATSNYQEGWGAVVGEAMGQGCAVVSCEAMGAVPYLIQDGENGISFANKDVKKLYTSVEQLLADRDLCKKMGIRAYNTMHDTWNSEIAAERLLQLIASIRSGAPKRFEDGPCSKAYAFGRGR